MSVVDHFSRCALCAVFTFVVFSTTALSQDRYGYSRSGYYGHSHRSWGISGGYTGGRDDGFGSRGYRQYHYNVNVPPVATYGYGYGYQNPGYGYGYGYHNQGYGYGFNQYNPYSYYGPLGYSVQTAPPNISILTPGDFLNGVNNLGPSSRGSIPNLDAYAAEQARLQQQQAWSQNNPDFDIPLPTLPSNDHQRQAATREIEQGKALLAMQQYQRSLAKFKLAVQNAPDLPEPYFCLALNYISINHPDKAVDMIERGLRQDPTWPFEHGVYEGGLARFYGEQNIAVIQELKSRVVEWTHEDVRNPQRLFLLGFVLILEGDYDKSRLLIETAGQLNGMTTSIAALLQGLDQAPASVVVSPGVNQSSPDNSSPELAPAPQSNSSTPTGTFPEFSTPTTNPPSTTTDSSSTTTVPELALPPLNEPESDQSPPRLLPPLPDAN